MYVAKDQKTVHHLIANEGCANPSNATARLQVLVNGVWLPISVIKSGWVNNQPGCPVSQLGKKDSLAWADVYLDPGTVYRWFFTGEVNIFGHDGQGHGISASATLPKPVPPAPIPISLPVATGKITFDNILENIDGVAQAAYDSVQSVYAANPVPPAINSTTWIGPNTPVVGTTAPDQLFAKAMRLWAGFNQPKFIASFYFDTQDEPAAEVQVVKWTTDNNIQYPKGVDYVRGECPGPGLNGNPLGQCYNANSGVIDNLGDAIGIFGVPDLDYSQLPTSAIWAGNIQTHEFTHMVQGAQFLGGGYQGPTNNYQHVTPCWLQEGMANFAGFGLMATFQEYLKFRRGEALHRKAGNGLEPPKDLATISNYLSLQGLPECESTYSWGYATGVLVMEALSAIGGAQSTMALYTEEARGNSFTEAFKLVYGVSWDYAQPILAQVLAKDYLLPSMNG